MRRYHDSNRYFSVLFRENELCISKQANYVRKMKDLHHRVGWLIERITTYQSNCDRYKISLSQRRTRREQIDVYSDFLPSTFVTAPCNRSQQTWWSRYTWYSPAPVPWPDRSLPETETRHTCDMLKHALRCQRRYRTAYAVRLPSVLFAQHKNVAHRHYKCASYVTATW